MASIEATYVGIVLGCTVFGTSILVVLFLLYYGGSFDRMRNEAAGLPETPDEAKPRLSTALLHAAHEHPLKPNEMDIHGTFVHLRSLDVEKDLEELFSMSDRMNWQHSAHGPFPSRPAFREHLVQKTTENDGRSFVIVEIESKQLVGMISIGANEPNHLCCQLAMQRWTRRLRTDEYDGKHDVPVASVEAVYLLLKHLFQSLKYRRVEWRCDGHDVRSRKDAHALGFTFETLLRQHRISKESNVDTALFGAIDGEWIAIRELLEKRLTKEVKIKRE